MEWRARGGEDAPARPSAAASAWPLAWHPRASRLASTAHGGAAVLVADAQRRAPAALALPVVAPPAALAYLAGAVPQLAVVLEDWTVLVVDESSGEAETVYANAKRAAARPLRDGTVLHAVPSRQPPVLLLTQAGGSSVLVITCGGAYKGKHTKLALQGKRPISALACHPYSPLVFVATQDGAIKAYDMLAKKAEVKIMLKVEPAQPKQPVSATALAFVDSDVPGVAMLVAGDSGNRLHAWSCPPNAEPRQAGMPVGVGQPRDGGIDSLHVYPGRRVVLALLGSGSFHDPLRVTMGGIAPAGDVALTVPPDVSTVFSAAVHPATATLAMTTPTGMVVLEAARSETTAPPCLLSSTPRQPLHHAVAQGPLVLPRRAYVLTANGALIAHDVKTDQHSVVYELEKAADVGTSSYQACRLVHSVRRRALLAFFADERGTSRWLFLQEQDGGAVAAVGALREGSDAAFVGQSDEFLAVLSEQRDTVSIFRADGVDGPVLRAVHLPMQGVARVYPGPTGATLTYVTTSNVLGLVPLSDSVGATPPPLQFPLHEEPLQVLWQRFTDGAAGTGGGPWEGAGAVLTSEGRALLITTRLTVHTRAQDACTSIMWMGPSLLYTEESGGLRMLDWSGGTSPLCSGSSAGATLIGATADRVLLLHPGSDVDLCGAEVKPRPIPMLQPLVIGWATAAASGVVERSAAKDALKALVEKLGAAHVTPPVVQALKSAGLDGLVAALASVAPQCIDGDDAPQAPPDDANWTVQPSATPSLQLDDGDALSAISAADAASALGLTPGRWSGPRPTGAGTAAAALRASFSATSTQGWSTGWGSERSFDTGAFADRDTSESESGSVTGSVSGSISGAPTMTFGSSPGAASVVAESPRPVDLTAASGGTSAFGGPGSVAGGGDDDFTDSDEDEVPVVQKRRIQVRIRAKDEAPASSGGGGSLRDAMSSLSLGPPPSSGGDGLGLPPPSAGGGLGLPPPPSGGGLGAPPASSSLGLGAPPPPASSALAPPPPPASSSASSSGPASSGPASKSRSESPEQDATKLYLSAVAALNKNSVGPAGNDFAKALKLLAQAAAGGGATDSVRKKAATCMQYKLAMHLIQQVARRATSDQADAARLARHLAALQLDAKHRVPCIRTAITHNMKAGNFAYAKRKVDFLLSRCPPDKKADLQLLADKCVEGGGTDADAAAAGDEERGICMATLQTLPQVGGSRCSTCAATFGPPQKACTHCGGALAPR